MIDMMEQKTILIVDDENMMREAVASYLEKQGYHVLQAETGTQALSLLEKETVSFVILDLMLPDISGEEICSRIRRQSRIPIIMLTAKTMEDDMLNVLNLGADDYISKPFMPQELLLRVYAVLRRTYKEDSPRVFLDGCTIDFSRAEVNKGGEIIPLTAKEHTLLETLARNEGKIVTVDALCEALWGDNPFGYENSLNAHVRRIREKIEADPSKPVSLITIKGLGYKLITRK